MKKYIFEYGMKNTNRLRLTTKLKPRNCADCDLVANGEFVAFAYSFCSKDGVSMPV
jgi:hypothetical protein